MRLTAGQSCVILIFGVVFAFGTTGWMDMPVPTPLYGHSLPGNSPPIHFAGLQASPSNQMRIRAGILQGPATPATGQARLVAEADPPASGNLNGLLRGTFCHWSGSSGSGSSYSHSIRATFDGNGRFTYSSESSFSSGSGLGYGGGGDPSDHGMYRVVGNRVHLAFSDGSTGVAAVYNQAADGTITELMYEGDLYAPALCE